MTVIDGATNTTITVPVGTQPLALAVNPVTNKVYVTSFNSGRLTVIDGATNATTKVFAGFDQVSVAVNPVTNKIYVGNRGRLPVRVIDGITGADTPVLAGTGPHALAVNPVTNKIYVANHDSNDVTIIDGASNTTNTVRRVDAPIALAVNQVTNRIYVANEGVGFLTVIDGATNNPTTIDVPGSRSLTVAVNPASNKIYVINFGNADSGFAGNVAIVDGATQRSTSVASGPRGVAAAVNPFTNKIYVANFNNNVTVLSEQETQPIPLTNSVTPLVANKTNDPAPTFTFSTSSTFSPTAPPVNALYFQFDTWQGPWIPAISNGGGSFNATAPTLSRGIHILYAYATDGQDATSIMPTAGGGSSPLIGAISAYLFLVVPPPAQLGPPETVILSPTSIDFGDVHLGTGKARKVMLTNTGAEALQISNISVTRGAGSNAVDFFFLSDCRHTLAAGKSCIITVIFLAHHPAGTHSATLNIEDSAAGSPRQVGLTATVIKP